MEKIVLVPLAGGAEEIEAVTIIDILRRAGINVIVAGLENIVTCSRGVKIVPDKLIDDISTEDSFDAIILPGGLEGTKKLAGNSVIKSLLNSHKNMGSIIGAICAAPLVLSGAGVLQPGDSITSHPSVADQFEGFNYRDDIVVTEGKVISSRGAGTAIEFSLKIVELLAGKEIADSISRSIIFDR